MFRLILGQLNWGVIGSIFGFTIGFFLKIYLIDIVGLTNWGKYVTAQTFSSISETFLSIGIPYIIIKFMPSFIDKDIDKAKRVANIFLKYSFVVGFFYLGIIYIFSSYINKFIYNDIDNLSFILFIMCCHVPISMLFGVIVSLYRSVLKIKEIVIYGTFISVTIRALLTLVVFQYTSDISYFILIEVFAQVLVLSILLYLFSNREFSIFVTSNIKEVINDNRIIDYGKNMFYNSVIAFVSSQALSFIISIRLPMDNVGAYNILLSLTGLTTFLLINLNKVFAPAISKLYHQGNIIELNELYKQTTFVINLFTIPLVLIITVFSDEILSLYTYQMSQYKNYLFLMLLGGMCSLCAGSSGTLMLMTGLEKKNLNIQIAKAITIIILALFLIPIFGMKIVVILYVVFMLLVNALQVLFLFRDVNIHPFSKELLLLFIFTSLAMLFAINQDYLFSSAHYFTIPICIYLLYFVIMFPYIKKILKKI